MSFHTSLHKNLEVLRYVEACFSAYKNPLTSDIEIIFERLGKNGVSEEVRQRRRDGVDREVGGGGAFPIEKGRTTLTAPGLFVEKGRCF